MGPLPPVSTVKEKWKRRKEKKKTYLRAHSSLIQKWSFLTPNPGTKPLHTQETLSQQLLVSYYSCTIESVLTYGVLVWCGSRSAADRKALQRIIETRHHQLPPSDIFIHKNSHQMILAQFLPCSHIHTKHWTWKPLNSLCPLVSSCSPNTYTLRQLVLHLDECLFVLALWCPRCTKHLKLYWDGEP